MLLEFVKKHWFTLALLLIVLVAIVRKNILVRDSDAGTPSATESREKYTEDVSSPKATALLHLADEHGPTLVRLPAVDDAVAVAFLKRFAQVAVTEQEKFGMPASVLLATAYLNSFAGQRACAVEAHNYLATRCTADWNGPVASVSGVCFRQYQTAWESIRDFGTYCSRKGWHAELRQTAPKDWKRWIKVMAAHRVSDVQDFEQEASRVIEEYRLFELD